MEQFLAELVFPGVASSVTVARHCVGRVLKCAGHQDVDNVLIVVSELVGNAVLHTDSRLSGGLVTVDVSALDESTARITVIDQGSVTVPRLREFSDTACAGRGLSIVEQLSAFWGVREDALGGRAVWAEVHTTKDTLPEDAMSVPAGVAEA
ncbi:ATP-binding protein [Nonomuraea insulae]|uniref:ATP-binding protein n=1 Tax=Nonomuraea insulae TaxID=1616787 RepID=A0ABW1D8C8_9ACTN